MEGKNTIGRPESTAGYWTLPDDSVLFGCRTEILVSRPGDIFVQAGFHTLMLVYRPGFGEMPGGFVGWISVMHIPPEDRLPGGYKDVADYSARTGNGSSWPDRTF